MSDLTLLQSTSPLLGILEMASLRLPDTDDYEVNSRRRLEHGVLTSSSTDSSSIATHFTSRMLHFRQSTATNITNRRILGDSGSTLIDLLFDIASKNNNNNLTEKLLAVDDYDVNDGVMGSNTTNDTYEVDGFYRHTFAITAAYFVAYLFVFAVGLVGNCFVIAVVYRSPRMRTVTNYFIVNLAVADILVIIFCLPATLMSNIFVPWILGWWMCKTVPYIQGVSVAASVYSLIAVSLDRFLAIWWPLRCQITKPRARFMIVVIWLFAFITTIPWALYFKLEPYNEEGDNVCVEVWPDSTTAAIYFVVTNLVLFYILPTIVICMCYILIYIKVWKRTIPTDTKDAQMERMQQKSKFKVVKMLVVVVILFVVSWLPLYAICARMKLGGELSGLEETVVKYVLPIAQWLGSSNSCINPILYAFFNNKYRCGFLAILKSRSCCGRLRYYETVAMMSSSASSMRKSSYYVNNNNSSTRRQLPATQDAAVSYISNNTGI